MTLNEYQFIAVNSRQKARRLPEVEINEYQQLALRTWKPKENQKVNGMGWLYPLLGLVGEAGEVAEKLKKVWRNNDGIITDEMRASITKEIGDVMWYTAVTAYELGLDLEMIARVNIEKLSRRLEQGTIRGEGDDR